MPINVFISYSSVDKEIATEICAILESAGVSCSIAPRDPYVGAGWSEAIQAAIDESDAVIVVLSAAGNVSSLVIAEVERAVAAGTKLFTVLIEDVRPVGKLVSLLQNQTLFGAIDKEFRHAAVSRIARLLREQTEGGRDVSAHTDSASTTLDSNPGEPLHRPYPDRMAADPPSASEGSACADAGPEECGLPQDDSEPTTAWVLAGPGSGRRTEANASDAAADTVSRPDAEPTLADLVQFAAYAPRIVDPDSTFVLSVWAFLETQRREAEAAAAQRGLYTETGKKGPVRINRGTTLTLRLSLDGFEVEDCLDTIHWEGQVANASFKVGVRPDCKVGNHTGCVLVMANEAVLIARVHFTLAVGTVREERELPVRMERIKTAFASYASEDRVPVMQWARGARDVGVDVFLDVLSLRAGQHWEEELWKEIPSRDAFCLFWSQAARSSAWVEKEWRCALSSRGHGYIHPVPLVDPREAPPPPELGSILHFNDLAQIAIKHEQAYGAERGKARGTVRSWFNRLRRRP